MVPSKKREKNGKKHKQIIKKRNDIVANAITVIKIYPELDNAYMVGLYGTLSDKEIKTWVEKHTKRTVTYEIVQRQKGKKQKRKDIT